MTHDTDLRLEHLLRTLYEAPAPSSIDVRVAAAIDARRAAGPRTFRRRTTGARLLLAAVLVTTLAVTAAAEPIRQLFSGWGPEYDLVSELSTPIGQSQTIDGYRVTVVRAYADPLSLRIAILGEDLDGRADRDVLVPEAKVTDERGVTYLPLMAAYAQPDEHLSESWIRYRMPEAGVEAGTHRLQVEVPTVRVERNGVVESRSGPWSFAFDLPFRPVVTAYPGVTSEASGIAVTFDRLDVGAAMAVGHLSIEGLPDRPADWAWDPWITVTHDCTEMDLPMLSPGSVLDSLTFEAIPGATSLAGTWTITIDRFNRDLPDPSSDVTTEEESVIGPWVLRFEGPRDPSTAGAPAPERPLVCVSPDRQQ